MTEPRQLIAAALQQVADAQSVDVNVIDHPAAQISAPALIVRPDNPWRVASAATKSMPMAHIAEGYAIVAIVLAGDPASSIDDLRRLIRLIESIQDVGPFRWIETMGVVQVTENGIDYLGATARMQYLEG